MNLKTAIEIGKGCGLTTVAECVLNIEIHKMSIFSYSEMDKEVKELRDESNAYDGETDVDTLKFDY